jgi:Mg-chelatase subunit ChlD
MSRRVETLLLLLAFLWPMVGGAGTGQQIPLDAVVLMDDSGSMRKTDPLKLRFSAFSLFIRLLRDDDAVGIVKFDDDASIIAPLQVLEAAGRRPHLDSALAQFLTRGAYTNIYAGLKVALEEMQQRSRETPEKAVILISDGIMDVNSAAGMGNEEALRKLRDTLLPAYRQARVKIVTLALSPAADRALLEEIAATTDGHFFYVPQAQALSQALYSIFDNLKGPEMIPVVGQRLIIDPSVKEATFFIITGTAKDDITLVRPDGVKIDKKHKETAVKWYVGKDYVLVTVQEPLAGEWHVDMPQQHSIKVAVVTDVRLEVALDQERYVTDQAVEVAARLVADGASNTGSLPLEELIFIAEVIPPNASEARRLSLIQQRQTTSAGTSSAPGTPALGEWHSTVYTSTPKPGEYRGRVIANAPTFSREKSFVFRGLSPMEAAAPANLSNINSSPIEVDEIPVQASVVPSSSPPQNPPADASEGAPLPDQVPEEEDLISWTPWMKALRRWAIGHGILFALGGLALIALRVKTGAWWKLPQNMTWRRWI